MCLKNVVHGN
ncbi:Down syndrome cell adhesion molecule-like protein Dscam2, partial [Araneus ventricosus]